MFELLAYYQWINLRSLKRYLPYYITKKVNLFSQKKLSKGGDNLDGKITLKAARVNAGLTQKEVAKMMKKNESTIVNWENGNGKNIKYFDFKKLCKLYKKNIDEIFFEN